MRRAAAVVALAAVTILLAACGGDDPGSPAAAPQVGKLTGTGTGSGRSNEAHAGAPQKLGYQRLLDQQSSKPAKRFSPCSLVTRAEARAILDEPVVAPSEAPQGPTCIYRSKSGRAFVTLAVQSEAFTAAKRRIERGQPGDVAGRAAVCGQSGQSTLYVALPGQRVLSVGATCPVARRFASHAVSRLDG